MEGQTGGNRVQRRELVNGELVSNVDVSAGAEPEANAHAFEAIRAFSRQKTSRSQFSLLNHRQGSHLLMAKSGRHPGLGGWWADTKIVRRAPILE